ncbi:MAG: hypothetical protein AB8B79_00350 [Granulosicoccus sp.]
MQKCLNLLIIGLFAISQTLLSSRVVLAQYDAEFQFDQDDSGVDVEPPLIEHEIVDQSDAGIRQTFVATVVDDRELDTVLLYYRFAGETSYSRYRMMRVSFSSTYVAQIPTNPKDFSPIEYYIQARDTSGNRTVRGYTFSPLVRQIVPVVIDDPSSQVAASSGGEQSKSETSGFKINKTFYVIAGVVLLGLLASAAGSSGGSSAPSGECAPAGCQLTLTVNRPTP